MNIVPPNSNISSINSTKLISYVFYGASNVCNYIPKMQWASISLNAIADVLYKIDEHVLY